jgi:hypothetical protein
VFVDFQSGIVVFLETFGDESILKHKLIEHSVDSVLCDVGSANFDLSEQVLDKNLIGFLVPEFQKFLLELV